MKCPNCAKEVSELSLVKRSRNIHKGFVVSNTQLFCPACDAEVAYKLESRLLGVGGFVVFVLCGLIPLATELARPARVGLLLLGALAAIGSATYRAKFTELRLVEKK